MKKIFRNKTALLLVVALIVGFGGTFAYLSMTTKKEAPKSENSKTQGNSTVQTEKGGGLDQNNAKTQTPAPAQEKAPTSTQTSLGSINASVTAQKSVSDDSISILFYIEGSGTFSIQEKSGSTWQTTKENVSYAGTGGLNAGVLAAGQASKTLRALKIENGKYTAVTKEFTINRSEVDAALGIKTYN